jgi:3-oxoadipate enol-lactonase
MWAEQVPVLLEAGYRVLRTDLRGHGGSEPVPGDYTMDGLAGDIAAVVDALGIPAVHFIGLSIGGMVGQAFALNHGAKARSVMLCDTLPATAEGGRPMWQQRIAAVREAKSVEPMADGTMERWFTPAFKPRRPGRWKQLRDSVAATSPEGFIGCGGAILNFNFVSRLPSLRMPVLVVCGAADEGTPPSENKRIAGLVPGARYEEIAEARHFPNVEQVDVFNRIMLDWLKGQR